MGTGGFRLAHVVVGLVAAGVLVLLTTVNLEGQGPQYDELHQAPGAFRWLGSPTSMFCAASAHGVCLLNMSYSGAIKTNLYGAYLRLGPRRFSLSSWRLFGIVPVAIGLVPFAVVAAPALPPWALSVVLALLLTDINVLLNVRFDGGPVALSLVARLLLIAVWLRDEAAARGSSPRASFVLGAVTGLAIFEKLSAIVLIAGLAVAWLGSPRRRTWRHLRAMGLGLAVGVAPLVAVNLHAFVTRHVWVSLGDVRPSGRPLPGRLVQAWRYLSLGEGAQVKEWILDLGTPRWASVAEAALIVVAGLVVAVVALRAGPVGRLRLAGLLIAMYGAVAVGLNFMPRRVSFHHQILGTPYQYVAVALALVALGERAGLVKRERALRASLAGLVAVWIGLRLVGLWPVEIALAKGAAGPAWDPSLRDLGTFAAARQDEAVFVASDWGVGTQPHCFVDGRRGVVYEPFWRYEGVRQLHDFQRRSGKRILYLIRLRGRQPLREEATRRIENDLAGDPSWREVDAEPEARAFRAVVVRKFVYATVLKPG